MDKHHQVLDKFGTRRQTKWIWESGSEIDVDMEMKKWRKANAVVEKGRKKELLPCRRCGVMQKGESGRKAHEKKCCPSMSEEEELFSDYD